MCMSAKRNVIILLISTNSKHIHERTYIYELDCRRPLGLLLPFHPSLSLSIYLSPFLIPPPHHFSVCLYVPLYLFLSLALTLSLSISRSLSLPQSLFLSFYADCHSGRGILFLSCPQKPSIHPNMFIMVFTP